VTGKIVIVTFSNQRMAEGEGKIVKFKIVTK